jgi:SPP1 gp7 family putative phage head morphogenesis protein
VATAKRRPKVGRVLRPSAGIRAAYRKKLEALTDEMHRSLVYWLSARWRSNTPVLATDENPTRALRKTMRVLSRRWEKRFDEAAPKLAEWLARQALRHATKSMEDALEAGKMPTVDFKMTAPMRDAFNAVVGENVSLIKSIAQRHLSSVEASVMRSVSVGRDLGSLANDLQEQHGVTKRRAALIARDQSNKASAVITRVRQIDAGIEECVWEHSHAGKKPRPSHVAFSGQTYSVKEGALIDGERIFPGQLINCRCFCRPVLEGF